MNEVFICDAVRTPIGRYGGSLSSVRTDDLAAVPLRALMEKNPKIDWNAVDDVIFGCANQAGEDNRNVARMALLLAGFPETVPGVTVNRLCGSGMEAVGIASRMIRTGDAELVIAGGVESMSRAPFVMDKSSEPFSRNIKLYDTTIGWRFINKAMDEKYGTESMMQTAENIAADMAISRADQDAFALRSQEKVLMAQKNGLLAREIIPVVISQPKGDPLTVTVDEHPRATSIEKLNALKPLTGKNGTITAGNSSGVNDGAAALIIASESAVKRFNLKPIAKIASMTAAGVLPRVMGLGPVPATEKLLARLKLKLSDIDLIELNEAFAAQALGCLRKLNIADDDPRVNPQGGAIALGHPLGMSGARLVVTAAHQINGLSLRRALCTMCIGVGQGVAMMIENAG